MDDCQWRILHLFVTMYTVKKKLDQQFLDSFGDHRDENAELERTHQKYKGRVVLRDDIVKDDSGSYAAFTEQGSSASQMTAVKIMDIISRLPGCDGQAADAVSVCTQVKMEDAHKLKIPKSECPDIWIRLPRHKWLKSWSSMEDPVVPLEQNLYGHLLAGLSWERQFEKILLKRWGKVSNWEGSFVHRETLQRTNSMLSRDDAEMRQQGIKSHNR